MKKFLIGLFLFIFIVVLYSMYIEPTKLNINYYSVSGNNIPDSFEELKVIHFGDILYNKKKKDLDKLLKSINELEPDIVIFSGDLLNKNYTYKDEDYNDLKEFLTNIEASLYKYSVIGDNDTKYLDKYKDIMYDSNFVLLNNEGTLLFYKDINPIRIIGISNNDTDILDNLLESEIDYNYSIVITHMPDNYKKIKESDVDLVLAGHSIGGYINIPFYGPLFKNEGSKKYYNYHYKESNTELYVTNGISYEKYNVRLFNTPSFNVYRFSK